LSDFIETLIFLTFSKNTQISNFMKVDPVQAELLHAEGWTGRHYEANSHLLHFVNAHKNCWFGIDEGVAQSWELILLKIRFSFCTFRPLN
jgi:hypothetical protein